MARVSQEEMDQIIARAGGGRLKHSTTVGKKKVPNPDYIMRGGKSPDAEIELDIEQWVGPDGHQIQAVHLPDGSWEVTQNEPGTKTTPGTTRPTNVYIGTNPRTGKPTQISEYPDPSAPDGVRREYDDTQVPAAAAGQAQPPTTEDRGGRRYVWQPNPGGPSAGGKWVDVGSAPETPAERQAREAAAPSQSVTTKEVNGQVYTIITIVPKPGQPGQPGQVVLGPDGKVAPGGVPGEKPKPTTRPVDRGGVRYTEVVTPNPDGSVGISYLGPDGKPIARLPSEGEATAGGPAMPDFTLYDSVEQVLVAYHGDLANDPSLTPEQRVKRFQEAREIANLVVQDRATRQREQESLRNTRYNVAAQRLGHLQQGTQDALTTIDKLNGLLPAGSPLGGQAFAALLGLNMLQLGLSGIDNVQVPTITPGSLSTRQGVEAVRQQITATAQQVATPPNAIGLGAIGNQPAPGAPGARPSYGGPTTLPSTATPTPVPGTPPAAVPPGGLVNPDRAVPPTPSTTVPRDPNPPPSYTAPPESQGAAPGAVPSVKPDGTPDYGSPDMRVLPAPAPTQRFSPDGHYLPNPGDPTQITGAPPGETIPYPSDAALQSQMAPPASDFPVLAQARPPMMPQPVPDFVGTPPAMLATQARTREPWRMTPDEIAAYQAAGVPDEDIFGMPGRLTA